MAVIKSSPVDEKFFNLNGLLYQKGLWEIYYDSKTQGSNGLIESDKVRVGIRRLGTLQEPIQSPVRIQDWYDELGNPYSTYDSLINDIVDLIGVNRDKINTSKNELGFDAWGRSKSIRDISLFHSMFTYNVPISHWEERFNSVVRPFVNATSENGKLSLEAGNTLNDNTVLKSFRNPRYEPNRGHLYSSSMFLPDPNELGNRRFGTYTNTSGTFFSLESGVLYAVVRTTVDGLTTDDKYEIDTEGFDLSKGNIYDIQMQWRGVGNYKFFINLQEVKHILYIGTRTELTMFNPANPVRFECENKGDNVVMECGCVDVTSEGGENNGKTYGSVSVDNNSGQVPVSGFNHPIIAIRSKEFVNGKINTRDTLALLATAYADQRAVFRVWATRDFSAITANSQVWRNYGDGHLEYLVHDVPDVATPMTFNPAKATLSFSCRLDMDQTYSTSALFDGKTSIYLTPKDMLVFTIHRETGTTCNAGMTFEFAESI